MQVSKKISFSPKSALFLFSITVLFLFFAGKRKKGAYHPFWVKLTRWMLKTAGWELEGPPPGPKKFVTVGAFHTSNWDLPAAVAMFVALDLRLSWMGKDSLFKGPFGPLFRVIGGVPIDRSKSQNAVEQAAEMFYECDDFVLAVAAEGTRSERAYWKSGFYYIALKAQVPVHLGYADYKRKRLGIAPGFVPTGNIKADMDKVRTFYEGITPLHPQKKSRIRLKVEDKAA